MDRIDIHAIKARVNLGVPAWERRSKQTVWIDLGLELPLAAAGTGDDFTRSPDYHATALAARETAQAKPYRLVEALAEALARNVLKTQPKVRAVNVRVLKKPSVMRFTAGVSVSIRRRR